MSLEKLNDVRARIAGAKRDLQSITAQRRSRKEATALLDATVGQWVKKADAAGTVTAARAAAGDAVSFLTINARVNGPEGASTLAIDFGPIAVMLLGAPAVRDALAARLADVPEGLSEKSRTKKIGDLATLLDAAQYEEEGLIRSLEAAGETVAYRPDADPKFALTWKESK